ncbi:MAG: amidase [Acidimicrobiales bacterium]|nr:amidase [Acidimicrobiales bacterium]
MSVSASGRRAVSASGRRAMSASGRRAMSASGRRAVFVVRLDPGPGDGPTVAVKDLIDVEGFPTTCGSKPVAAVARPAERDAACVATIRANGGRIVGKTTMHELAFGGTGINPFTGTPTNPLDPTRVPGGSSSGSAVAVATGEADVALGTDTGGSIRTPSACCGTVGLKTTHGRIPLDGVHPLAPSLDVLGPMAAGVADVEAGMALLETGFRAADAPATRIGRFRLPGTIPPIDAAIDAALAASGIEIVPTELPGWLAANDAANTVAFTEALEVNADLVRDHAAEIDPAVMGRFERAKQIPRADYEAALNHTDVWRAEVDAALERTPVLALAGIVDEPPPLDDPLRIDTRLPNVALNLSGHPAIVLPIPRPGALATSLQLVAGHGREDLLVATARVVETAVSASP